MATLDDKVAEWRQGNAAKKDLEGLKRDTRPYLLEATYRKKIEDKLLWLNARVEEAVKFQEQLVILQELLALLDKNPDVAEILERAERCQ
jgi:hypothetical protein